MLSVKKSPHQEIHYKVYVHTVCNTVYAFLHTSGINSMASMLLLARTAASS